MSDYSTKTPSAWGTISIVNFKQKLYGLDVKTFPKCLSLGMAQGNIKKSRNKKMAYTHHNDAMTSVL